LPHNLALIGVGDVGSQIDYTIELDNDLHVVRIQAHGRLDFPNAEELSIKARETASKYNYGVFYDFRDISLSVNIADVYRFPRENKAVQAIPHRHIRAAFLVSSGKQVADWEFYETVSRNCGLANCVFVEDEKNALNWASGRTTTSAS